MLIKTLVIEDDPIWQEKIIKSLTADQFEVTQVYNITDAIDSLNTKQFDLICTDLNLPDSVAASNTLKRITSTVKHIPIIVTTTIEDKKIIQFAFSLSIVEFIIKNKFDTRTFVNAAISSIKHINKKITNEPNEDLEQIAISLQELEKKLMEIDKNLSFVVK